MTIFKDIKNQLSLFQKCLNETDNFQECKQTAVIFQINVGHGPRTFPKDVNVSKDENCSYVYDLFGTRILQNHFIMLTLENSSLSEPLLKSLLRQKSF